MVVLVESNWKSTCPSELLSIRFISLKLGDVYFSSGDSVIRIVFVALTFLVKRPRALSSS